MYSAVLIAATGLTSQQRRIDVIADNLANINTTGYKSSRLDFKDALYTAGITPGTSRTQDGNQQKGHGTITAAVTKDFSGGNLYVTGTDLDLAIEGEGFFELDDGAGNILFTRLGTFTFSDGGENSYVMNSAGQYVLDMNDERIPVPLGTFNVDIDEVGVIKFKDGSGITLGEARIGVFTFTNNTGLQSAGESNYTQSDVSGEKILTTGSIVRQGTLEGSNVNISVEMTRLIRTQRAFSLASRALKTADDMEGIANTMKK